MVYRLAYAQTRSRHDADDIFQEVFLQTVRKRPVFDSVEHEKAWLIRVTINACKDLLKSFFRSRTVSLDEVLEQPQNFPRTTAKSLRQCCLCRRSTGM